MGATPTTPGVPIPPKPIPVGREFNWTSDIVGFGAFPSGKLVGRTQCVPPNAMGMIQWHFEGTLTTNDGAQVNVRVDGRTKSGPGQVRYMGVVAFTTDSPKHSALNELTAAVEGRGDASFRVLSDAGFEWV